MKIHLFQELLALEGEFGHVIHSDSVVGAEERILLSVRKNVRWTECFGG